MPSSHPQIEVQTRGTGRPIVLLHAYPLSKVLYDGLEPPPGARLLLPDFPGFGDSPGSTSGWTLESFCRGLEEALERLHVQDPILLGGVSMGGYAAMEFLRLFPNRVAGVLFIATRAGLDGEAARSRRLEVAEKVEREGTEFLVRVMTPNLLGATTIRTNAALVDRVQDAIRTAPRQAVAGAQRAMADRRDQTGTLRALRVPALWLAGAEDKFVNLEDARQNAELNPLIRLHVMDQVGHLVPWEAPEAFQSLLNKFHGSVPG